MPLIEAEARTAGELGAADPFFLYESQKSAAFTKFNFLGLTQYERVMFIASHQIVLRDLSHLFRSGVHDDDHASAIGGVAAPAGICTPYDCGRKQEHGAAVPSTTIRNSIKEANGIQYSILVMEPNESLLDEIELVLKVWLFFKTLALFLDLLLCLGVYCTVCVNSAEFSLRFVCQ